MKLSLVLLVFGILGYCLNPSDAKVSGGSIQDEFAVSIRERAEPEPLRENDHLTSPEVHADEMLEN